MKPRQQDDWGLTFGSDPDAPAQDTSKKKPKQKNTLASLVYEFRDQLLMDTENLMNSQVNAPAMMKAFNTILDTGRTHDDIRAMITQFHKDINIKPLTDGIPAWKAFIGRLDSLAKKVGTVEENTPYDGPKIDPRLMSNNE
jgi:hypothetical protein